jgi:hypothetical protein
VTPLVLLSLTLAAPVPKDVSSDLTWKFKKGDTFYVKYDSETTSEVAGAGVGGGNGSTQTTAVVCQFTVASADDKGAVLEVEYVSFRAGVSVAGRQVAGGGAAATVTGLKVTATLDADRKVTKLDGSDAVVKAAGNGIASQMLSEEYTRYWLTELLQAVPPKPLKAGGDWKGEFDTPFYSGMRIKKTSQVKANTTKDGVATISVESDYAMSPDKNQGPGLSFEMKGEKNPSTVQFDTKKGRPVKIEETHEMTGGVNVGGGGAGGQNLTVTMKGKSTTTISDEKPKED